MKKYNKPISAELKSKIIPELLKPNRSVPELHKLYGVSQTVLYRWRREYSNQNHLISQDQPAITNSSFIEVAVSDVVNPNLKSAHLNFADFSLMIEGKITSSILFALVKTVEESC